MILDFSRQCKLPGNTSFFNIIFDLFSIIAKKVNQIRKIVACVVAHLAFLFYCALTTGCCNVFQHIFVNQKNRSFQNYISRVRCYILEYDKHQNIIHLQKFVPQQFTNFAICKIFQFSIYFEAPSKVLLYISRRLLKLMNQDISDVR